MGNFLWYLMTAGRDGEVEITKAYKLNMLVQFAVFGVAFILWLILSQWFFSSFKISAYWNLTGENFSDGLMKIWGPVIIFTIAIIQSCWISSGRNEGNSVVAQNIAFKSLISIFAGIFEELSHRGIYIYFGLILVNISNTFYFWIISFIFICIILKILKGGVGFWLGLIIICAILITWMVLYEVVGENPSLVTTEWILQLSNSVAKTTWINYAVGFSIASITMLITFLVTRETYGCDMVAACYRVVVTTAWFVYVFPLAVNTLLKLSVPVVGVAHVNAGIISAGSDHWVALLYVSAIIWSNIKFRDAHSYQGPFGMFNSWLMGLYLIHITFTYGLVFAIVLHVIVDLVIFWGEHIIALVRNLRSRTF